MVGKQSYEVHLKPEERIVGVWSRMYSVQRSGWHYDFKFIIGGY